MSRFAMSPLTQLIKVASKDARSAQHGRQVEGHDRPGGDLAEVSLSPAEFVARTGLSPATVRRYLKSGRLPKSQPGGPRCRVMIPVSALRAIQYPDDRKPNPDAQMKLDESNSASIRKGPKPKWMSRES